MTLSIVNSSHPTREQWARIWGGCDYATFFHAPEWAELWHRYRGDGVKEAAELLRFSDGTTALLPLSYERKGFGLLNRTVSSFDATYGGWIASDSLTPAHAALLVRRLVDERGSLVWRLNPYDPLALSAIAREGLSCRADETHAVPLGRSSEELLKSFKKGCREDIRKAMKRSDLQVGVADTEDEWRAYHRVYQDALRRWGELESRGYPWEFFQLLFSLRSPHVRLWITRASGAIVSGELVMYGPKHAVSWHAVTLEESLKLGVAKLQTFRILQDATERGLAHVDFNPSAGLQGVAALKESFRPSVYKAPVVYVDSPVKKLVRALGAQLKVGYAKLNLVPAQSLLEPVPASAPCEVRDVREGLAQAAAAHD
jgi:hypothetical protein